MKDWPRRGAAGCVRLYQLLLSPLKRVLLGPYAGCRFHPTCSEYARQALLQHGFWRGSWLSLVRLLKCHPFHPGGEDPVPPAKQGCRCVGHANGKNPEISRPGSRIKHCTTGVEVRFSSFFKIFPWT